MIRVLLASLALALAVASHPGLAAAQYPVDEARFRHLTKELRCLVCQSQSIYDSPADLAADMRRLVLAMMREGRSDEEIKAFLVARYGDFVLFRPPFEAKTWALWAAPFVLLAAGTLVVVGLARARRRPEEAPLDERERALAEALLREGDAS